MRRFYEKERNPQPIEVKRPPRAVVSEKEALKRMKKFSKGRSNSLPRLEQVRVELYIPYLPMASYRNLLLSFEKEFTYAFGGCTIIRGLDGNYLSQAGVKTPHRISLIYTYLPLAFGATNFETAARYADELKQAAAEAFNSRSNLGGSNTDLPRSVKSYAAAQPLG